MQLAGAVYGCYILSVGNTVAVLLFGSAGRIYFSDFLLLELLYLMTTFQFCCRHVSPRSIELLSLCILLMWVHVSCCCGNFAVVLSDKLFLLTIIYQMLGRSRRIGRRATGMIMLDKSMACKEPTYSNKRSCSNYGPNYNACYCSPRYTRMRARSCWLRRVGDICRIGGYWCRCCSDRDGRGSWWSYRGWCRRRNGNSGRIVDKNAWTWDLFACVRRRNTCFDKPKNPPGCGS